MKYFLGILLSFCIVSESFAVGASGFSAQFVGAKALGQGNAFAGQADDPSALYFNPAGITQLKGVQMSVGATALLPITDRGGAGVEDDAMKRQLAMTPNFYITGSQIFGNEKLAGGIGWTSPYGITTEWTPTSSVRYTATESKFQMINFNPTLAYEVLPTLSIGAGVDYVNLFNTVAKSQINQALANGDGSADGASELSGRGSGWGYNAGALFKPAEKHSFGIAYRSQVRIPIRGSVELHGLSASTQANYNFSGADYNAPATSSIILPASILTGYAFKPNSHWTLLADYEWTQWNSFQNQDVAIQDPDPSRLAFLTGDPTSNVARTSRQWRNVSAFGVGANYQTNKAWQLRGGYTYFEKTVPNDTFSPDIPDAANHLLTAGLSRSWESVVLDIALIDYLYVKREVSNQVGNAVGGSVNGTYKTNVPAIAVSLTYKVAH